MIISAFLILGVACIIFAMMWARSERRFTAARIEFIEESAKQAALLLRATEDSVRLAELVRLHVTRMDEVAKLLGGKDDKLIMADERKALRLHDELLAVNIQPPSTTLKNETPTALK